MSTQLNAPDPSDAAAQASIAGFQDDVYRRIDHPDEAVLEDKILPAETAQAARKITQEKAESANKAKTDFLADMHHEIRTPMSAIIGLARVLLKTQLDDRQKQCLAALHTSAEALMAMINDQLDIDRIESGVVDPKRIPFSMPVLLDQIIGIMSVKAQEKGIGLALRYEGESAGTFIGDSGRIRQIAMNLIGNAIKFTEAGGVTVSFADEGMENGKKQISISVADTGIGIPEDKMVLVFDRFAQANSSVTRKYGGTGLGLSISKALAESMGGRIAVASAAGKGSTFTLLLPMPTETGTGDSEKHAQGTIVYLARSAKADSARARQEDHS